MNAGAAGENKNRSIKKKSKRRKQTARASGVRLSDKQKPVDSHAADKTPGAELTGESNVEQSSLPTSRPDYSPLKISAFHRSMCVAQQVAPFTVQIHVSFGGRNKVSAKPALRLTSAAAL